MNYAVQAQPGVGRLAVQARARFILRTYGHLLGAVLAFAGVETALFVTGAAEPVARAMMGVSPWLAFGALLLVSMAAGRMAQSVRSRPLQYAGLALYVAMYAVFAVGPLLMADHYAPGAIRSAGLVTVLAFTGLTAIAFTTRKDFSFLGGLMRWGIVMSLVAIVASLIFGFELGTFFAVAMVGLMGAGILHETSNVLLHYDEDSYVAAALSLFSYTVVMFLYLLRIFSAARD